MAAPHNKARYGEIWPEHKLQASLDELLNIQSLVVLSGGWAWHFLSPVGHEELKHAHDHKDIDIFVEPTKVAEVVTILKLSQFEKVWTKYDKHESKEDFRRYEKIAEIDGFPAFRITVDFFVRRVPHRKVKGWLVTEPDFLLSLYSNIHSSDKCFAVSAAKNLLARGLDPENRVELIQIPKI